MELRGDPALFMHRDEVECAWNWIDGIIDSWAQTNMAPQPYVAGTWGPTDAVRLLDRDGHTVVAVGDAKNATRTALLALQLSEMDVPYVLALNMMDVATTQGHEIDPEGLASALGCPVIPIVASRRHQIPSGL